MGKAIGIDLGTTNSVVAFKDTSVRTISTGADSQDLCRSCVGIRRAGGEMEVGNGVYTNWKRFAPNIVVSVKRLMGASFTDSQVQVMKERKEQYPFGIDKLSSGTDESVAVIMHGRQYTPEQISAEILKRLKEDASVKLGEITHAVITVPAYFNEKQKTATRKAAEMAGLKVQRLLAEPTAAAISYGVDKMEKDEEKVFLVYDFGGGTFDLSILVASGGNFIESGAGGDRWLGGDDIDRKLMDYVLKKTDDENGVNTRELIENLSDKDKYEFQGVWKKEIEDAKKTLSQLQKAEVTVEALLENEDGDPIDINVTITRAEFENMIRPLVQRTIELVDELLDKTGYPIETIDNILLVGGSSCIPLVRKMLTEKYGDKVLSSEKPMLAVAEGAAILAHSLSDEFECPNCGELVSKDNTTCPHCKASLDGISAPTDDDGEPPIMVTYTTKHATYIKLASGLQKIVDATELLPCEVSRKYHTIVDNQKIVEVVLLQDAEDGNQNKITSGFFAIPDNLPKGSGLSFTFSFDENENMSAKVKIDSTGKTMPIVLGREKKDSKCLDFISSAITDVIGNDRIDDDNKNEFMTAVQKCVENITAGRWGEMDDNWTSIEDTIRAAKTTANSPKPKGSIVPILATILIGEFGRFIQSEDAESMQQLIGKAKSGNPMERDIAERKLEDITNRYSLFTTMFMFKMVSMNGKDPAKAAQAGSVYEQMMNALNGHNVDYVRTMLDKNIHLLEGMEPIGGGLGTGID